MKLWNSKLLALVKLVFMFLLMQEQQFLQQQIAYMAIFKKNSVSETT